MTKHGFGITVTISGAEEMFVIMLFPVSSQQITVYATN